MAVDHQQTPDVAAAPGEAAAGSASRRHLRRRRGDLRHAAAFRTASLPRAHGRFGQGRARPPAVTRPRDSSGWPALESPNRVPPPPKATLRASPTGVATWVLLTARNDLAPGDWR